MSTVGLMEARPPFVRFKMIEKEDRAATIEAGYYVPRNIAHAEITAAGGKDSVELDAEQWLKELRAQSRQGVVPLAWYDHFKTAFDEWKEGNEIPEFGTPVLTYLPFSPQQRQALINANVRTLEDCAVMNEETMQRVGMGGRELKEKAKAALASANVLLTENEALKAKLEIQEQQIENLRQQIAALGSEEKKPRGRPRLSEIEE